MTDEDIVARVSGLIGIRYGKKIPKNPKHKPVRASVLMRMLRPYMGIRRKAQIDRALSLHYVKPRRGGPNKLSQEQAKDAIHLADSGYTLRQIASKYKVHHVTILRILKFPERYTNPRLVQR